MDVIGRDFHRVAHSVGHAQREVILDHPRSNGVEEHILRGDRIVAVVPPGAHRQSLVDRISHAEFDNGDVFPAEARAIRGAKGVLQKGGRCVADRADVAVENALNISSNRQRASFPGKADTVIRRNIKAAVVSKQTAVFAEFAHVRLGLIGGAKRETGGQFANPADAHADAIGGIVSVIRQIRGGLRCHRKSTQAICSEGLMHQIHCHADGLRWRYSPGETGRNKHLLQIDPGAIGQTRHGAADVAVARVHPAVAIQAHASRHGRVDHVVGADFRDDEVLLIVAAVGRAVDFGLTVRAEQTEPTVDTITD